jgi:hypothetical protein
LQSICASPFLIIKAPEVSVKVSKPAKRSSETDSCLAKTLEISTWFIDNIVIPKFLPRRTNSRVREEFINEIVTSGGLSETEVKELTVIP